MQKSVAAESPRGCGTLRGQKRVQHREWPGCQNRLRSFVFILLTPRRLAGAVFTARREPFVHISQRSL